MAVVVPAARELNERSAAALENKLATLTVEQREALDKDLAKKERKEDAKAEKEKARIAVRSSR